jgi:hypothetical protein
MRSLHEMFCTCSSLCTGKITAVMVLDLNAMTKKAGRSAALQVAHPIIPSLQMLGALPLPALVSITIIFITVPVSDALLEPVVPILAALPHPAAAARLFLVLTTLAVAFSQYVVEDRLYSRQQTFAVPLLTVSLGNQFQVPFN